MIVSFLTAKTRASVRVDTFMSCAIRPGVRFGSTDMVGVGAADRGLPLSDWVI